MPNAVGRFFVLCSMLLLSMCTPPNRSARGLFAVDSLLHAQASHLVQIDATLDKQIVLGTKQEAVTLSPRDTTAWLKELEVFEIMNIINKPISRDSYKVSESTDTNSNLRVRSFLTTANLPVSYVNLYYHNDPAKIRKVEALYSERNGLYKTSRLLTLEFHDVDGKPILTDYSVLGGQKMLLDDTVQYDIKGHVRFGKLMKNGKAEH